MISLCHAKCMIVQLKEENGSISLPTTQRGIKGNIIVYPQQPTKVSNMLPPSIEEITAPLCILFMGAQAPTVEWLRTRAKPLAVNGRRVRRALQWLKKHNPLYKDVILNEDMLTYLDTEPALPFSVQHIPVSEQAETLTSRYEGPIDSTRRGVPKNGPAPDDTPFERVVITDVDVSTLSNKLRAAALTHVKSKGGGYIEITHDPTPVNEFNNPDLFLMMYPTLFPYGIGGLEDHSRTTPIKFQSHVKHLMSMNDTRFQQHYTFMFTAFNMVQCRKMLLHTSLKVKKKSFPDVAQHFGSVSAEAIVVVSQ
ncbi:uncharacterized protein EV420DRAFT_1267729 [Desarmillaria tabescens]|uniref:DUF6570 domain-containing protein n=1 Tax=Armillaria tabescens TaxID=1929756 RepID=A0AA39TQH4_ARMTA|nr:uncharacterized protein EV420DRAFT_1267729 [Desarmillaria tabescens]KAK0460499.1 hypothetical protein EV420DRAFT_1267729 [Desarmillaria tabescens]